jgi:hypothetical protein
LFGSVALLVTTSPSGSLASIGAASAIPLAIICGSVFPALPGHLIQPAGRMAFKTVFKFDIRLQAVDLSHRFRFVVVATVTGIYSIGANVAFLAVQSLLSAMIERKWM